MKRITLFIAAVLFVMVPLTSFSYTVPEDYSGLKYFYVFGPQGHIKSGADDHELTLFIDVPKDAPDNVLISVYDPTTGGKRDWRTAADNPWDTVTRFEVVGRTPLDKMEFPDRGYDRAFYDFGPYPKSAGKKVGNFYRFLLTARALSGDDANLFKVRVTPDSAQVYSYNLTFRLSHNKGDKMTLYPAIPAGTNKIVVENYDLDALGGTSSLYNPFARKHYKINDSPSGEWSRTVIPVEAPEATRFEYVIIKGLQRHAHAGVRIRNERGNLIPIYFRKGPAPQVMHVAPPAPKPTSFQKCQTFTFDGTKSHDPDDQNLTFLWDFDDGTTSSEPIVTHTFEKSGDYNVTLMVTDNSGLACDTDKTTQVVHVNTSPAADFTTLSQGCIGQDILFDASSTTDNTPETLTYHWSFGDGTSATGKTVTKAYRRGGPYIVKLTVDDNEDTQCSLGTVSKRITVNSAPIANAGRDISRCYDLNEVYEVSFDGSASRDNDGDQLTYTWDFGDGAKGTGKAPTHVYDRPGTYRVTLAVSDAKQLPCSSSEDEMTVTVNKPPIVEAGKDRRACVGEPLDFETAVYPEPGETLKFTWNFGDGNKKQGSKVRHVYQRGGTYKVTVTADDGKGMPCSISSDGATVSINSQPAAAVKQVETGCVGKAVMFDASSSRDPDKDLLAYTWDFGDGTVMGGSARMTHVYQKGGRYRVKVTVDDQTGTACAKNSDSVAVMINTPPVADAGPNLVCCVETDTPFDGSKSFDPDGDSLQYSWDFGDGGKATGAKVTHVYQKGGSYTVSLTVTDSSGTPCNSATDSFVAEVKGKPVAVMEVR